MTLTLQLGSLLEVTVESNVGGELGELAPDKKKIIKFSLLLIIIKIKLYLIVDGYAYDGAFTLSSNRLAGFGVTRHKFQSSDEVWMGILDMLDQLKIKEN